MSAVEGALLLREEVLDEHLSAWLLEAAIRGEIDISDDYPLVITHGTAPPHPSVHQILDRMFDGRSSIKLGSYDADFTKGWNQLKGELGDWLHGSAHWDTAGRQRQTVVRIAGALALVIGLGIGGFAVADAARTGLGPAPLIAAGAAIAGAAIGAIRSSFELLVRTETGSALWLASNPSAGSSKTSRPVTWRRQPRRASCATTQPGPSLSAKPAPGPVPSRRQPTATRRYDRRSAKTWRSSTSDRRSPVQQSLPQPRRRVRTAAVASPADPVVAAGRWRRFVVAEVLAASRLRPRSSQREDHARANRRALQLCLGPSGRPVLA